MLPREEIIFKLRHDDVDNVIKEEKDESNIDNENDPLDINDKTDVTHKDTYGDVFLEICNKNKKKNV